MTLATRPDSTLPAPLLCMEAAQNARSVWYHGITEGESVDALESRSPDRSTHPTFGRGFRVVRMGEIR